MGSNKDEWVFYAFHPSFAAPIVFIALFGVSFLLHVFQTWRARAFYMIPFCLGVLGEVLGYGFRYKSVHVPTGQNNGLSWYISVCLIGSCILLTLFARYIAQTLCIILAPALCVFFQCQDTWPLF
jgi:hypothetical protein